MAIYNEILIWANNKPVFLKDALRRIISSTTLSQNDIDELVLLLKKENGDTSVTLNAIPIDNTHIPTTIGTGTVYPKLISIKDPINICALHNQGHLQFPNTGLTVVYGNNGSGKSSYSRILRKLCWSRNSDIELKKNVFSPSTSQQKVDFIVEVNGTNIPFQWLENSSTHSALSSIFVYDNDCGNIYVNNENPTQYKPIGIDVLERLIPVLNEISQKLSSEITAYNTQKPVVDQSLIDTNSSQWYSIIESKIREEIESNIQFSPTESARKQKLFALLNSQNPQQNIQNLTSLKARIENYIQQFKRIEERFKDTEIQKVRSLRSRYESVKLAYDIATNELSGLNTIAGFGTNPWRTLWDAAKNFAKSNGMTDGQSFPSAASIEKCVFCQQDLDESAKQRLLGFSRFILNDISTQLSAIQREIEQKTTDYNNLVVAPFENFAELEQFLTDFQNQFGVFNTSLNLAKTAILNYLQNGGEINVALNSISTLIESLLPNIAVQLDQNIQLLTNRDALVNEYNELVVNEFLFNNKPIILQYFDEYKYKERINICKSKLNINVSRKIGEFMEVQAVTLQHQEFINHLSFFNQDLSTKVLISKTRTTDGSTFQKCGLNGIAHSIDSVLSEGEKKVIALSNFLADCTIDNRKNSIVFDDPVTSLDMDYRDLIATKIVELSRDRQIIVLTHDLSFLRLLIDTHKTLITTDCHIIGIDKFNGISGIITDEIPYLAKNVDERVESIRRILREHDALNIAEAHGRETKLDSARKRFRFLIERSVEEVLANKTYERFSKNIHLKKSNLSSFIVVEQSDVDFLLGLFGKYSIAEHDGGTSTIPQLPTKSIIEQDIRDYMNWKNNFKTRHRTFIHSDI
ncbi:MAG: AAA family ATPase [Bacteroidetes bacterium]|nr:AAA family ATPase [Bacteroidota bacterium]MBU1113787.1 AAA family ATPase [Bacteroidota bacterium]MBU1798283.1 AAA family ATPase [Bacteroidota bacterium]